MMLGIEEIILSSDSRERFFSEKPEGITDVVVRLSSGERFIASFFTYEKLLEMSRVNESSHKFLDGLYFWVSNMILIDNCEKRTIQRVIEHLIEEGDFFQAFCKISDIQ